MAVNDNVKAAKKYHGIDIGALKKGDVLTEEDLDRIYHLNVSYTDAEDQTEKKKQFFLMRLYHDIEQETLRLGKPLFPRFKRNDLHILNGKEASEYKHQQFERYIRGVRKVTMQAFMVDVAGMTPEEVARHEKNTYRMGEQVIAVEKTRNHIGLGKGKLRVMQQLREKEIDFREAASKVTKETEGTEDTGDTEDTEMVG